MNLAVYRAMAMLLTLALAVSASASDEPVPLEQDAAWRVVEMGITGTWRISDAQFNGAPDERMKGSHFIFRDDKMIFVSPLDKTKREFRIRLDRGQRPHAIDMTALNESYKGQTAPGIFELSGDKLRIAIHSVPEKTTRPKDFVSRQGTDLYVFVLERVPR